MIEAWSEYCVVSKPNKEQITTEKLWFSNVSKFNNSIVKSWDNNGLRFVADLINSSTGTLYSKEDLEKTYGIRMTFLCYASLIRSLPNIVKESNFKSLIQYPIIPYKISMITGKINISRVTYKEYVTSLRNKYEKSQTKLEDKWIRDVGDFRTGTMLDICKTTKNSYIQAFHFRLISRIIATNKFLRIIGLTENATCTFCLSSVETIHHLFWNCTVVQNFISKIADTLGSYFDITYHTTQKTWFFPNVTECELIQILINAVAKITIYSARHHGSKPSIIHFLNKLKLESEKEYHSARLAKNIHKFNDKWKQLKNLPKVNINDIVTIQ